jgi:ketosteroid isomerase-like protein
MRRAIMGEARAAADRLTAAIMGGGDDNAVAACYTEDAVAVTPDQGQITGRESITAYLRQFIKAFPDAHYDYSAKYETGNVAIDEGYFAGTNTGDLELPDGERVPATGKSVRVRDCEVMIVEDGLIREHRFYFDQMEFLGQLGLLPQAAASG